MCPGAVFHGWPVWVCVLLGFLREDDIYSMSSGITVSCVSFYARRGLARALSTATGKSCGGWPGRGSFQAGALFLGSKVGDDRGRLRGEAASPQRACFPPHALPRLWVCPSPLCRAAGRMSMPRGAMMCASRAVHSGKRGSITLPPLSAALLSLVRIGTETGRHGPVKISTTFALFSFFSVLCLQMSFFLTHVLSKFCIERWISIRSPLWHC